MVQAAIAACHRLAPSYAATDWDAVVSWYDVLLTVNDTPVTGLGRSGEAVAAYRAALDLAPTRPSAATWRPG